MYAFVPESTVIHYSYLLIGNNSIEIVKMLFLCILFVIVTRIFINFGRSLAINRKYLGIHITYIVKKKIGFKQQSDVQEKKRKKEKQTM